MEPTALMFFVSLAVVVLVITWLLTWKHRKKIEYKQKIRRDMIEQVQKDRAAAEVMRDFEKKRQRKKAA